MRRLLVMVVMGVGLASTRGLALDSNAHPSMMRHQLMMCMSKRMSANRTLSYYEAAAVCKAQLKAVTPATLASRVDLKPLSGVSQ